VKIVPGPLPFNPTVSAPHVAATALLPHFPFFSGSRAPRALTGGAPYEDRMLCSDATRRGKIAIL